MPESAADHPAARPEAALVWWGRAALVSVLAIAVANSVGWATGIDRLTRVSPSWPYAMPWSAALVAGLGVAVLVQSGRPSRARVWVGCGLAVVVGVLVVVFLAEYVTGRSFGIDQVLFPEALRALQSSWQGRPSPQTASSVLLLSLAVGLTRLDRRWTPVAWAVSLVATVALPFASVAEYAFEALPPAGITRPTGMGISMATAIVLLVAAIFVARPDRNPLAWLLARPDRRTLARVGGILAVPPILIGLARPAFLSFGLREDAAWVLSITVSTIAVGAVTFYLSQHEQKLLIEKELLSRERAELETKRTEAEERYRLLADNAVDVVVHHRGSGLAWVSPSVQTAFGWLPSQWIGTDLRGFIHPDDLGTVEAAMAEIGHDRSAHARCRIATVDGDYHWVDVHAKNRVDTAGNADGVITTLHIVDDQVEAQQQLERLARIDALTGLVNRAETIGRLESALRNPRTPGAELGVLFCDIDRFKAINDTWGHGVGDVVLSTVADRICQSVRHGDTVGRTGGDEMLVLLPGLHSLDEAAQIAEKIRSCAAEPIHASDKTIHVALSIGATIALRGESVLAMTARADEAMYQAKRAGGNSVTCI
ncbi:MAG: diguanylate cyclase [Mycobacterium sp.]|nr:diguanylate cyclase [Mycobacterium sp.]